MKLQQQLDVRPDLQDLLFRRGFLVSQKEFDMNAFPFYGNWIVEKLGNYFMMTHHLTSLHYVEREGVIHFLFGHAYNPFTMQHEEVEQLQKIADCYAKSMDEYCNGVNELTGVFVMGYILTDGSINFIADPSGMQSAYYGNIKGNTMITSHPQIIGDLYNLEMDSFIKELIAYKFYPNLPGPFILADLSAFNDIKRIVPNNVYTYNINVNVISHKRFYNGRLCPEINDYTSIISKSAEILKNNLLLISKKWSQPSISLTGGIDSNTTFAAANGCYEKYTTFSYLSAHKESIDVDAAKKIAEHFKIPHQLYTIPSQNQDIFDYEIKKAILVHNSGYIAPLNDNEIRKRIYLQEHSINDVEVKSWVSETFRAAYHHRYRRSAMPVLSAKLYRNIYKIFLWDRKLVKKIDVIYDKFISEYGFFDLCKNFDNDVDMHFWEVTWGSWGGVAISEMKSAFDVTIPYNNRILLDLQMRIPLNIRMADAPHKDMKKLLNKELFNMNIQVCNMKETDLRGKILNLIFTVNMLLPF